MMQIVSFDAKDFRRSKKILIPNPENPEEQIEKVKEFYTPLGVGVLIKNPEKFVEDYLSANIELSDNFFVKNKRPFYSSFYLKDEIDLRKAFRFCDDLVKKIQEHIEKIHICYLILSKEKHPTVNVGGTKSPTEEVETPKFLRIMQPMFSYITAWNFQKINRKKYKLVIDGFSSKETIAWRELINHNDVMVYPHGDECNPFISLADIIAFLTDLKLYNTDYEHRQLFPENVKYIWEDYSFDVECRFLDEKLFSKYRWESNDMINYSDYLARPVIFLLVDEIEKLAPSIISVESSFQTTLEGEAVPIEPKKFRRVIQKMEPYQCALKYAIQKNGCLQFFDPRIDSNKVKDGDVIVYMGEKSKSIANALYDAFDITKWRFRDLKKELEKREKANDY